MKLSLLQALKYIKNELFIIIPDNKGNYNLMDPLSSTTGDIGIISPGMFNLLKSRNIIEETEFYDGDGVFFHLSFDLWPKE